MFRLRQRWWRGAIYLVVPIAFGLFAVSRGRDANWDLQNYHWYNPYALLTWRYNTDITPAIGMSYFAPLLYVPWFVLGNLLPARAFGFIVGAVQSVNLLLLYHIALVMLPIERRLSREAVALLLAVLGMIGGMSMGLLGTTFIDSVVTIGILGSLLAIMAWLPVLTEGTRRWAAWRAAIAAIPAALALAGKLTMAPFAIGLAAGFLVLRAPLGRRFRLVLWFGIGGAITAILTTGPWLLLVWWQTGDPFYPFYASWFHSPFGGPAWTFDRWKPTGLFQGLIYPLAIGSYGQHVAEVPFTDWRLACAYVLIPVALLLRALRRGVARPALPAGFGLLLVMMAVAYALWLVLYAYYRYAVTLELLAPLAITLAITALPFAWQARTAVIGVIMIGLVATTRPADWGHLPWTTRFVEVAAPPIAQPDTATVFTLGQPISYVVPSLPRQVAVVGIDIATWDGGNPAAWSQLIRERLALRGGAAYAIMYAGKEPDMARAAAPFGLVLDAPRCQPMATNLPSAGLPSVNTLSFCPFQRTAAGRQ